MAKSNAQMQIVCIDDETDILDLYSTILQQSGPWNVVTFSSSLSAKAYIEKNFDQIGAIICDYKMPELTGLDLLKQISAQFGNLPFLLVSGYIDKNELSEFESKISAFIEKPVDSNAILSAAAQLVSKSKANLAERLEIGRDFASEVIPKVEELEKLLLHLEKNPKDIETVRAVYRILHTIKGTASSVGLAYLALFSHAFEARLIPIRDRAEDLTPQLMTGLLAAQSLLFRYFEKLQNGELMELPAFEEVLKFDTTSDGSDDDRRPTSKIHVEVDILNSFLEGVGELTILRNLITQKLETLSEHNVQAQPEIRHLISILTEMNKTQSLMQKSAMDLLKVPFQSLLPMLNRNVRDLCLKLEKSVKLNTKGESTLLDYNALQALADSLVHLLRNSMDHGIEIPLDRQAKGKSPEGIIQIDIIEQGEKVLITVGDDGKGVDCERVAAKAIETGLRSRGQIDSMSQKQIMELIFESGFSTASSVTQVSGRGVGMDMVKKSIQTIGGSVSMNSEKNRGTTFEIQIPRNQSLRIIRTMVVSSDRIKKFAVPSEEILVIEKVQKVIKEKRMLTDQNKMHLLYDGEFIQVLRLTEQLNDAVVIFLQRETQKSAVIVDNVESAEETVLRELDAFATRSGSFSKAAISGRHGTLLYLDVTAAHKIIGVDGHENLRPAAVKT